jgi:hypothetical protein
MTKDAEFQEKLDVLDIIINILKDHEEALSKISDRFDSVCDEISAFQDKISVLDRALERLEGLKVKNVVGAIGVNGPLVTVKCKDWQAFKGASQGALLVAYEVVGEQLIFSSVSDLFVFTFIEGLPEISVLMAGTRRWINNNAKSEDADAANPETLMSADGESAYEMIVSPKVVKRWLSSELGVSKEKIVEGRVIC